MNSELTTERELFAEALELSPGERTAFLRQACGTDNGLLKRVEDLLHAYSEDCPVLRTVVDARSDVANLSEGPASKIGRYKLLQKIGEGGMGVVYMAEQTEPVTRKVALKIIKLGMDTREVVARFEAERQALAMMDHPNIAKVLDAGATETGRPYFVMEMVKGIPVTAFCDENKLSHEERLGLFVEICSAIQHAHQKGIIHRDIKPSNVMITLHGDRPVPKVIDFGIAKATQGKLTDKTLFTQYEQVIGTPAYMSPEQAAMSGLDIDTRSDIYALGVLLYELLTGKTPFDTKELLSGGYDELKRRIREEEPLKPSTRLSTMQDAERTTLARLRRMDPKELAKSVRGELDWIVMKAIDKDRARRYDTAEALARDVRRHLDGEPVSAVPPSNLYRFRKFARKHRTGLVVAASFATLLLAATGVSAWFAWRLNSANARIKAEAAKAQLEADKSQEIIRFFNRDILYAAAPTENPDKDITLRQVLDLASRRLENRTFKHPLVQSELLMTLGKTYSRLGEFEKSRRSYDKALQIQRQVLGEKSAQTAAALLGIAREYRVSFHEEEARACVTKAIEVIKAQADPHDPLLLDAYGALIDISFYGHSIPDPGVVTELKRLIQTAEERFPDNGEVLGGLYGSMVYILSRLSRYDEAQEYIARGEALIQKAGVHPLAITLAEEALVANGRGDRRQAGRIGEEAVKLIELAGGETFTKLASFRALVLVWQGNCAAAVQLLTKLVNDHEKLELLDRTPEYAANQASVYALCLCLLGRFAEATDSLRQTDLRFASKNFALYPRAKIQCELARVLAAEGRYEEALSAFELMDVNNPWQWRSKGLLLLRNGRTNEFEKLRLRAIDTFKDSDDRSIITLLLQMVACRSGEVLSHREHTVRAWMAHGERKLPGTGPGLAPDLEIALGLAHVRFHELDSAAAFFQKALDGGPAFKALAHLNLAQIAAMQAKPEQARAHRQKAAAIREKWPMLDEDHTDIRTEEKLLYDLLHEEFNESLNLLK